MDTKQLRDGRLWHVRHLRMAGLVGAAVDGELTDSQRRVVARHVAACWACSGYADTVRLIKHSLLGKPSRAPADMAERRLQRFAEQLLQLGDGEV